MVGSTILSGVALAQLGTVGPTRHYGGNFGQVLGTAPKIFPERACDVLCFLVNKFDLSSTGSCYFAVSSAHQEGLVGFHFRNVCDRQTRAAQKYCAEEALPSEYR